MPDTITVPLSELQAPASTVTVPLSALESAADFHTTNQKDAQGNATVDPNTIGTALRHFWQGANPLQIGQMLPFPKQAGGSGLDNPLYPPNIVKAMHAVKVEADRRWAAGDKVGATAKYIESIVPVLGPMLSTWGDEAQRGKWAALAGDAAAFATTIGLPKLAEAVQAHLPTQIQAATPNPNPVEVAAVKFGEARGIPIDAGVASGNRFVRGVQGLADHSPIGAVVAEKARGARAEALSRVAGELADEAHPTAVTAEQAGQHLTGTIRTWRDQMHAAANDAYDRLRTLEQGHVEDVPRQPTPQELAVDKFKQTAMKSSLNGAIPTADELAELRRMREELDTWRFTKHTFNTDMARQGGTPEIVGGSGGAPVYQDILSATDSSYRPTRTDVQRSIESALNTGHFNKTARTALEVARGRLAGELPASLPPSAGELPMETAPMTAPAYVKDVKPLLQPVVDQLRRQLPLTQQAANPGLHAMQQILEGPDFVPLSQLDRDLSTIKALARKQGGLAKFAVGKLEAVVRDAAERAGPDVQQALTQGRAATAEKYRIGDVLKKVAGAQGDREPVAIINRLTAPKDANLTLLRKVQDLAPDQIREVGRAYLDQLFAKATAEGGFGRGAGLQAEWQKLGPETKKALFPDASHRQALDSFFLLAKKIGESPNPSQSGLISSIAGESVWAMTHPVSGVPVIAGLGALSKILRSPAAVRLLTEGMKLQLRGQRLPAVAYFQRAAQVVGEGQPSVPAALPAAAQDRGSDR